MGLHVTGNTTHHFRNTSILEVSSADASRVVTSDWLDEQLADTYKRVGLRPGLLQADARLLQLPCRLVHLSEHDEDSRQGADATGFAMLCEDVADLLGRCSGVTP